MIGTIVNTCTIVVGTLVGVALHKGIKDKYKNVLYDALGLACFAIGMNAVVTNLPKSQYPVLFIAAMAIGTRNSSSLARVKSAISVSPGVSS